jgi:hypothetical protein
LKVALLFVVIGGNQIDIRPECVPRTTPEYLQNLVGSISGVIDDADAISAGPTPQPSLPAATPSSNSSFDHDLSDARIAEDKSTKSNGVNKSAEVVLV